MSKLLTVDPAGRVDVLAFRLAERGAQQLCPQEWPILAPHVERWAERNLGPNRLGDLPMNSLLWATNPLTAPFAFDQFRPNWLDPLLVLQTLGLKDPPSLPKSSSPVAQQPKAPITPAKMTTWSPADLAEAEAQRGAQYKLDTEWIKANVASGNKTSGWPAIPPLDSDSDKTLLWIALGGAAALGLVLLIRR